MIKEHITTIPAEHGFLWHFELLKLKTSSFYHEKLLIQKFKGISSQVLNLLPKQHSIHILSTPKYEVQNTSFNVSSIQET